MTVVILQPKLLDLLCWSTFPVYKTNSDTCLSTSFRKVLLVATPPRWHMGPIYLSDQFSLQAVRVICLTVYIQTGDFMYYSTIINKVHSKQFVYFLIPIKRQFNPNKYVVLKMMWWGNRFVRTDENYSRTGASCSLSQPYLQPTGITARWSTIALSRGTTE